MPRYKELKTGHVGRLGQALLDILAETSGVTVYGITDTRRLEECIPTAAFTQAGKSPRQVHL